MLTHPMSCPKAPKLFYECVWFYHRFSGGFGARDYRQTAAGGNAGGFGGRGGRNQAGHGGTRGFGGGEELVLEYSLRVKWLYAMLQFDL